MNVRRLAPTNEHLDYVAALLDDMWSIPGTHIRFGLDAIIGWIPGIGDSLAAIASCFIVFAAWKRGAPLVTLARMLGNILLESTLGAIPIVGDISHLAWKANRRNYHLLVREKENPGANRRSDWLFLILIILGAIAAVAIPIGLLVWLVQHFLKF
jgi:hypothetical protein